MTPAYMDLRHLRQHTPGGWLIVHPLLRHAAPKPRPTVVPMPEGYITARELAQEYKLSVRYVRNMCAGLPAIFVTTAGCNKPAKAYPATDARAICQQSALRMAAPSVPPDGYAISNDILHILQCAPSTLSRYVKCGYIRTTPSSSRPQLRYFYNVSDANALRAKLLPRWVLPGV